MSTITIHTAVGLPHYAGHTTFTVTGYTYHSTSWATLTIGEIDPIDRKACPNAHNNPYAEVVLKDSFVPVNGQYWPTIRTRNVTFGALIPEQYCPSTPMFFTNIPVMYGDGSTTKLTITTAGTISFETPKLFNRAMAFPAFRVSYIVKPTKCSFLTGEQSGIPSLAGVILIGNELAAVGNLAEVKPAEPKISAAPSTPVAPPVGGEPKGDVKFDVDSKWAINVGGNALPAPEVKPDPAVEVKAEPKAETKTWAEIACEVFAVHGAKNQSRAAPKPWEGAATDIMMANLKEQVEKQNKNETDQKATIGQKVAKLSSRVDETHDAIMKMNKSIADVFEICVTLTNALTRAEAVVKAQSATVLKQELRIGDQTIMINGLLDKVSVLERHLGAVGPLEEKIRHLDGVCAGQSLQIVGMSNTAAKQEALIKAQESKIAELQLRATTDAVSNLNAVTVGQEKLIRALEAKVAELETARACHTATLDAHRDLLMKLETRMDDAKGLQASQFDKGGDNETLRVNLHSLLAKQDVLAQDIAKLRATHVESDRRLSLVEREIDSSLDAAREATAS